MTGDNESGKPSWIKTVLFYIDKMFPNKKVKFVLFCIVLLIIIYLSTPNDKKWAIIILVVILILLGLIFQHQSDKKSKRKIEYAQKELSRREIIFKKQKNDVESVESIKEQRELLKDYISWNEKLKELFSKFQISDNLFIEQKENSIIIRNIIERDIRKMSKLGASVYHSALIERELALINSLIKKKLVEKISEEQNVPYDYRIKLTKKGRLLNSILSQLDIDE